MEPEEKERRVRQVVPIMELMIEVKKFDHYLSHLCIDVSGGTCNPEEALFEYTEAKKKLLDYLEKFNPKQWLPQGEPDDSPFHQLLYLIAHPDAGVKVDRYECAKWIKKVRALDQRGKRLP